MEADVLSRIEWNKVEVVAALIRGCTAESSLLLPPQAVVSKTQTVPHLEPKLSSAYWRTEQLNDPDISSVLQLVEKKERSKYKLTNADNQGTKMLLKYRKDLVIKNGLLNKKMQLKHHDHSIMQFILPGNFCKRTLRALHDDMSHMGMDRTFNLVQERYFWPKMNEDI